MAAPRHHVSRFEAQRVFEIARLLEQHLLFCCGSDPATASTASEVRFDREGFRGIARP
eukprot:CAMPEP_0198503248 /NCGR_PEP_ID=MMETSP1462-20131121/9789_1 /TAXON_ID=1333877 /ORGANISM="Brandtodinium nutriculum, Strain RCC3387" /LENGTH=57 /DNA_ID=CAMNT_0044232359 /DNA_START=42 /DNA_END=215 /DNA_ORIENTATION=-